ncbi:MAG: hypothetical protein U0835_16785 [Isosphaeraceae bacterium]
MRQTASPSCRVSRWFAAALLLALAPSARAADFLITFDSGDPIGGLAVGATLGTQYSAFGVVFTPNGFSGNGGPTGTWATNTNMTVVSSTGSDVGGLGTPSLVSGNLLRSFDGWLDEDGDPSFRATFAGGVSFFSADFAGIAAPASTRIFAYNGTTLLTTATAAGTGQQTLSVSSATPITSVVVTPGDFFDWVGVDNIRYTTLATAVPEPSPLLLAGVAALPMGALAAWRRTRAGAKRQAA